MRIPQEVRASQAVTQEHRYQGTLPLGLMSRLQAAVAPGAVAELDVQLQVDARSGWPQLHGQIHACLPLVCQRCDCVFDWRAEVPLALRLVSSEVDTRPQAGEVEAYCPEDDRLPLHELVEDEVLLALPMLPRCETCENEVRNAPPAVEIEVEEPQENPFLALKKQFKANQD